MNVPLWSGDYLHEYVPHSLLSSLHSAGGSNGSHNQAKNQGYFPATWEAHKRSLGRKQLAQDQMQMKIVVVRKANQGDVRAKTILISLLTKPLEVFFLLYLRFK